jgi:hypothetical protein
MAVHAGAGQAFKVHLPSRLRLGVYRPLDVMIWGVGIGPELNETLILMTRVLQPFKFFDQS